MFLPKFRSDYTQIVVSQLCLNYVHINMNIDKLVKMVRIINK